MLFRSEALRARGASEAQLDIIGRVGWGPDAKALAAVPGVTLHGYQPMERVREIVDGADMLISTSHDEGLGLPLLEAQYAGLPVIAPDKPVFREVLGASGVLIDGADARGAAEKITAFAASSGWRARGVASSGANLERWLALAAADKAKVIALIGALARGEDPC